MSLLASSGQASSRKPSLTVSDPQVLESPPALMSKALSIRVCGSVSSDGGFPREGSVPPAALSHPGHTSLQGFAHKGAEDKEAGPEAAFQQWPASPSPGPCSSPDKALSEGARSLPCPRACVVVSGHTHSRGGEEPGRRKQPSPLPFLGGGWDTGMPLAGRPWPEIRR